LALIIVFFVVITLSAMVLSLSEDSFSLAEYTNRTIDYENVYSLANKGDIFLEDIFKKDDPKVDFLGEPWSKELVIPTELGEVKILIIDQERYLNPNQLINKDGKIDKTYLNIFKNLFNYLNINQQLIYNIIDWIDKNKLSDGGQEIYKDYLAKNSYLDTPEELLLIKGFEYKILYGNKEKEIAGLKDFITTYSNGKVNINTASRLVLMALDKNIDGSTADRIIAHRKNKPFKKVEDLKNEGIIDIRTYYRIKDIIDIKSENFLVNYTIKIGDREYKIIMLIKREKKGIKKVWQKVL